MSGKQYDNLIRDKFFVIRKMLEHIEKEAKKMPFDEAYNLVTPIQDLLFFSTEKVLQNKNKREKFGDELLKQIK